MAINYLEIKKQIRQKLSKPIDFEDTDNLLELGLSSLVIMKLVNQWRKQGIKISFGVLMEHPTLREWWELIQKTLEKADSKKRTAKKEKRIMADMYQEFPLTDVVLNDLYNNVGLLTSDPTTLLLPKSIAVVEENVS